MDPNQPVTPPAPHLPKFLSNSKPLFAFIGLLIILPILVIAAQNVQRLFSKAAPAPAPATISFSPYFPYPGWATVTPNGIAVDYISRSPIYFSALAFDSAGAPLYSGVTYVWSYSSTDAIGKFIPDVNQPIASFTPTGKISGLGDIAIKAFNSYGVTTASIKICVGVPCPAPPTPPVSVMGPIDWMSRTSWLKAEQFSILYSDQNFTGKPDPNTTISINLSSSSTLEVAWMERGENLKLSVFYHFDKDKFINQADKLTVTRGNTSHSFIPNWPAKAGYPYVSPPNQTMAILSTESNVSILYRNLYWHPGIYPFTDLNPAQWSWKHVQKILPTRIMPPVADGLFAPAQEIARSDMALFLIRTYEYITQKKAVAVDTPFTDIGSLSLEIQDAIKKIYGLKITAGTSATTYSPDTKVNRAQMATFLSNLYKAVTGDFAPEVPVPFTDIYNEDIKWAQKPIARIYGLKITAGISPTEFGPYLVTTREQMATFIMNFIEATSRVSIPPSSPPFPNPTPTPTPTPQICAQVLTPARNKATQECQTFGNSCLPDGWVIDRSCQIPTSTPAPVPVSSPPNVTQTTQTFSQLANQLVSPPPTLPTSSPDSLPPVTIPPEASPARANVFIQIINLVQNFFKQVLGLP